MRRIASFFIVAISLATLAAPVAAVEPQRSGHAPHPRAAGATPPRLKAEGTDKYAQRSWIVRLKPGGHAAAAAPGLARKAGGRVGHVYTHAINGFQMKGSAAAAAALRRNARVLSVTHDHAVQLTETDPFGIARIGAFVVGGGDAYSAGFRGAGTRIAVIDTGIDLDHPDLAASIDTSTGLNCVNSALPPNDGHGHGTHVAGTAAAPLNNVGVVGVAPEAQLVPIKTFDDAGNSSEAMVLCGLDHVVDLNTDGDPSNDIDVANLSWGDPRSWGPCATDALHAAICAADAAGVVLIGGAGNNAADAGTFVPAAFPEVVSVSAIADFDGKPGGLAGCQFIPTLLANQCDDAFAFFSNYGPSVDVAAPGVNVYSTWAGGGYKQESGTSMATPHVSGVAALVKGANPSLTTAQIRQLLVDTGDLPDGTTAEGGCTSTTSWAGDPDGVAEPLVNALRAAQRAADPSSTDVPVITSSPADSATVSGLVALTANASHPSGIKSVQFFADGVSLGTDTTAPFSATWDARLVVDGAHVLRAKATSVSGATACTKATVSTGINRKGDWVGNYGTDGYVIAAWNQAAGTDLSALPAGVTFTVEQGTRTGSAWPSPTTDVRALESPSEAERRAGAWYHATEARLRLTFPAGYTGTLHVYAVDWGTSTRREDITVDDGSGPRTANLASSFNAGAWIHFPVVVPAGGSIVVKAVNKAGSSSTGVISGLFLGGPGAPLPPPVTPPPPYTVDRPGVKGDWVGNYGTDGYVIAAWNQAAGTDLSALPAGVTFTVEQGTRTGSAWPSPTTDVRALESPSEAERRAGAWYHATEARLRLTFPAGYTGTLHVYAVDWGTSTRREDITVDDGSGPRTANLASSFNAGAWIHFPVVVPAGGSIVVKAVNKAGSSSTGVISGLFLGGPGAPLPPPVTPPPPYTVDRPGVKGDWVGNYGTDGYVIAAWNQAAGTDLSALPAGVTFTVEQGTRTGSAWPSPTTDVRALESPSEAERRAGAWYHATEARLRLTFPAGYTGTLHVYAVDWGTSTRREDITVDDGSGPRTANLASSFNAGAWIHFPVVVPAGGSIVVKAVNKAGSSSTGVISGLFLGGP